MSPICPWLSPQRKVTKWNINHKGATYIVSDKGLNINHCDFVSPKCIWDQPKPIATVKILLGVSSGGININHDCPIASPSPSYGHYNLNNSLATIWERGPNVQNQTICGDSQPSIWLLIPNVDNEVLNALSCGMRSQQSLKGNWLGWAQRQGASTLRNNRRLH